MCDVPRCGSWSMQINQLPKQNLSRLALAGAHRSRSSVAVFWPEVEEVPSVLTPGPAIFLTKFSQPGLPSKASLIPFLLQSVLTASPMSTQQVLVDSVCTSISLAYSTLKAENIKKKFFLKLTCAEQYVKH